MSASADILGCQYLTFTLDQERYAVEIAKVREVLEFTGVSKVPRTPAFIRGIINLRGNVVPVVDLRLKFGLSRTEQTVDACIIIAEVQSGAEPIVLGALADSVQEVVELDPASIVPPPRMGTRVDTGFLRGMGKRNDQFIMLLDIERVLSEDDLGEVAPAPAAGVAPLPPGATAPALAPEVAGA
jgi:purine-binding chemotaxis protein CheW